MTVAEVKNTGKDISVQHLASVALPREVDLQNFARQQDMVADTIRSMRDQGMFSAQDAGIIIPRWDIGGASGELALYSAQ